MECIRVLLADDHNIVRHAIAQTLENEENLLVVAEADSGLSAVELSSIHKPDVILMDVNMQDIDGVEATKQILAKWPETKIIALSMFSDKKHITEMMNAGAKGYMLKSCSFAELKKSIKKIISGQVYLCGEATRSIIEPSMTENTSPASEAVDPLTPRETEILKLISEGYKNRSIGEMLNIKTRTAEIHRGNIKKKLQLGSTAELTKFAISHGLTSVDV